MENDMRRGIQGAQAAGKLVHSFVNRDVANGPSCPRVAGHRILDGFAVRKKAASRIFVRLGEIASIDSAKFEALINEVYYQILSRICSKLVKCRFLKVIHQCSALEIIAGRDLSDRAGEGDGFVYGGYEGLPCDVGANVERALYMRESISCYARPENTHSGFLIHARSLQIESEDGARSLP